jgi:hypothetical protein
MEWYKLTRLLERYEIASSQKPNKDKTSISPEKKKINTSIARAPSYAKVW